MALRTRDLFSFVVLLSLIQALQDGRITSEEIRNLIQVLLIASILPQIAPQLT